MQEGSKQSYSMFTFMESHSISAKHAGFFRMHFTLRRDKNKRITVSKSRRFSTKLQHFLGAGVSSVKMHLQVNKQQLQCRHPVSDVL